MPKLLRGLRPWLRQLDPFYESQKTDVRLLALNIANSLTGDRIAASMSLAMRGVIPAGLAPYCEVSNVLHLPGSGKVRLWQMQMLNEQVRAIMTRREGTGLRGYRFIYDEPKRTVSFYVQIVW